MQDERWVLTLSHRQRIAAAFVFACDPPAEVVLEAVIRLDAALQSKFPRTINEGLQDFLSLSPSVNPVTPYRAVLQATSRYYITATISSMVAQWEKGKKKSRSRRLGVSFTSAGSHSHLMRNLCLVHCRCCRQFLCGRILQDMSLGHLG